MDVSPKDVPIALMHLYRGEMGRMAVYRTRLDTTTNWAVGTSAALTTFALGQERVPHFAFLLVVFLLLIFLWMEARRFRFYELVRMRVRLLEVGFYAGVLGQTPKEGWRDALWASLESPSAPISQVHAASVRLQRHYLWLLLSVYMAWFLKLRQNTEGIVRGAAVGRVPGSVVLALALVLLVALLRVASMYRLPEEE
jgi:uncharacterized membrane protein